MEEQKIKEDCKHQSAAGFGSNTGCLFVCPFRLGSVASLRFPCPHPLSLSGYLFPALQEQTVMQTDVLWGG